jgi:hypothetical protein
VKKNRGDEPIGVIIHIYMKISQGDAPCSYLYLKQAKMSFFSFFFYKIREQEGKQVLPGGGRGDWYQWEGRGSGERV